MPNPPFTGADYIEWGGEKISLDFAVLFENFYFIFLILLENFRVSRTMVSCCSQGMDKRMALIQWDLPRELVSEGFCDSEYFPLSDTLS